MFVSASFVALSLLSGARAALGPVTDLHVVNKILAPDGFNRSTVVAGGTSHHANFPGPLIAANKGDAFRVNVINNLTDPTMLRSTTIHWHGIFQNGTSWEDGPAFVTQCPIAPQNSFLYEFSTPGQAGTFWYHSHLSTQYCDGLRGPIVIYDPEDPHKNLYDIDDETTVLTVGDWYHLPARSLGPMMNLARPTPEATLINGKGRFPGGPAVPLTIVNVTPGMRYRLRVINIACDPTYTFSIDGHKLTIIEVDGINTEPHDVDSIQIFIGQRYSFVLQADQPVANYWIRTNPTRGVAGFEDGINSAILRYAGAPTADPVTPETASLIPFFEQDLHPLENPGAPGVAGPEGADVAINLNITFDRSIFQFFINDVPFIPPTAPVLLQILSGARSALELMPQGSVYVVPRNSVIEVTIPGGSEGAPHPFHLHGHAFDVIRSAGSEILNFDNPVRRDVVNTGLAGDNVTFRFRTDNPGPWILHCHIDWHLEIGLAIVFAEGEDVIATETTPDSWNQLCPIYNGLNPGEQ